MKTKYISIALATLALSLGSCVKDLDTLPIDPNVETSESVYGSPESYKMGLAKLYGAFSMQGQNGGDEGEIDGVDGGLSTFSRALWNSQELCTDFAITAWKNDAYVHAINFLNWTSGQNEIISATYYRITFTVTLINEYLKQTSDEKLDARGTSAELKADIANYRNEARALRALMYSYGLDLFGNMPFVTENDPIGMFYPPQYTRTQLFDFIESELLAVEPLLAEPKTIEFGRLDKGLAWGLLSRLYLNSAVYTGVSKYNESITWAEKVLNSSAYGLASDYSDLFKADNNSTNPDVWQELIYTGVYDAEKAQTWGGTTFLVNGSRNGDDPSTGPSGSPAGWGGHRARKNLVNLFPNTDQVDANGYLVSADKRCIIYVGTSGQENLRTKEIADPWDFRQGYSVYKWRSTTSQGVFPYQNDFSSTDWIFMRLPEIYLNYAEATLRGGAGDAGKALILINSLRTRAYGNTSGNITAGDLTLNFILDERGRELYWEGFRRSDLIRYGRFAGADYLWPWKGDANSGRGVDSRYNLYPIPYADLIANPKLVQNPGY